MEKLNLNASDRRLLTLESIPASVTALMPFMDVVAAFPQLKTIRYVSASETRRHFGRPHGRCTWCASIVPPSRACWCGQSCIDAWSSINKVMFQRALVEVRDGCICSKCGCFDSEWEMDHITPVVLGGGLCTIDNFRTLCIVCHKGFTSALNSSLPAGRMLR